MESGSAYPTAKDKATPRIKVYFIAIEFVGIIVPIVISTLIFKVPSWFLWMPDKTAGAISLVVIGIVHATLFSLHEYTKKNIYYNATQFAYAAFFIYFIFITGGVSSPFIFLLMFPLLTSAVYLDRATTRDVGIFSTIGLAAIIFTYPKVAITGSLITEHVIQTALMGMISYFMLHIVIESLHQKSDKEEASQRVVELIQVDALKSDFLSLAQHQLRTPLTGVKWALESISEAPNTPDSTIQLKTSIKRVDDAIRIINDMLKTTSEGAGQALTINKEEMDMADMLREIIDDLEFLKQRKEVNLSINIPAHLKISGDRKLLMAALGNIIDNSFKYSPRSRVEIFLAERSSSVELIVRDKGIGIQPSDMKYIFERMYRGENAIRMEPNQSGIGLYIARKIVNLHGGSIDLTSELNKGTTVTVTLPK